MIIKIDAEALLEGLKTMDRVFDAVPMARHAREIGWATIEECRQLVLAVHRLNEASTPVEADNEIQQEKSAAQVIQPDKLPDPPAPPSTLEGQILPTLPLD